MHDGNARGEQLLGPPSLRLLIISPHQLAPCSKYLTPRSLVESHKRERHLEFNGARRILGAPKPASTRKARLPGLGQRSQSSIEGFCCTNQCPPKDLLLKPEVLTVQNGQATAIFPPENEKAILKTIASTSAAPVHHSFVDRCAHRDWTQARHQARFLSRHTFMFRALPIILSRLLSIISSCFKCS